MPSKTMYNCKGIYTCDEGSTNRAAVRKLIEESGVTADNSFLVKGVKIFAIFDPPHLLKNFRNHFMINDIHFCLLYTSDAADE